MKVADMIEVLKTMPQDAWVVFPEIDTKILWNTIGRIEPGTIYSDNQQASYGFENSHHYNYKTETDIPYKFQFNAVMLFHEKERD